MDPRKSSVWSGDDGLPVVSSMGSDESKNRCCVIDDDGSIGAELCEEKVVITGCNEKDDFVGNFSEEIEQPEKVTPPDVDGKKDGEEEETVESAAAKKKKKKKAKDKKAAASVEAKEDKQENSLYEPSQPKKKDVKVKVAEKKVPKHVREMQEILARRKEAEERKKKEEEERLRIEEEERRIEEEREREAEEIRQKRKMRKMEKKQEGTLLTAKQKREAAKNEALCLVEIFINIIISSVNDVL